MSSINEQKQYIEKQNPKGLTYWRSLDQLADTEEFHKFLESEFPNHAAELFQGNRRNFLKIMAASLALAGLKACSWPTEKIVPYARRPEGHIPGETQQFATSQQLGGVATGLLVTSYDARPIKVEGNPSHPYSLGAASNLAQASVLELYDPDRSQYPVLRQDRKEQNRTWKEFTAFSKEHFSKLKENKGKGITFLSETTSSPSLLEMKKQTLKNFPQATWLEYEPISYDNEREGIKAVTDKPLRPIYHFDQADVIVSLDADPLWEHPAGIRSSREFVKKKNPREGKSNRLYAIESRYSITGTMADHRLPIPSSEIPRFTLGLAAEIIHHHLKDANIPENFKKSLERFLEPDDHRKMIKAMAKDLASNLGKSLLIAGPQQPEIVHTIVFLLNHFLSNQNKTITYINSPDRNRPHHFDAIQTLANQIDQSEIDTLVILGGNPVYNAPADLDIENKIKDISTTIHLSLYNNETSNSCLWHLPQAHFLESWGDYYAYDGTLTSQQPLIRPLYEGKTFIELLAILNNDSSQEGHEIVQRTFKQHFGKETFDQSWSKLLHDGCMKGSEFKPASYQLDYHSLDRSIYQISDKPHHYTSENLEITFFQDAKVYDGRFANNGWLQELPDFHTKIAWDNAALLSPKTAEELELSNGDRIKITRGGYQCEIAVYIMPGQAPYSIGLPLGYGRRAAGRVGDGVGFNTYKLRTTDSMGFSTGAKVENLSQRPYTLAMTQDHHAIDITGLQERARRIDEIIKEATVEEYLEHPEFAKHSDGHHEVHPLWKEHEYSDNKWGMAIDLNSCIGCNSCVIACQAENNIPVVGKEQVHNGREMHWIRVDRYFKGDPETPEVAHQPMTCVHCENAPCEQVCPVSATVHSDDGLNLMVYNRCVGTRYCSNNCPYKVRRFNFFNYNKGLQDTVKMAFNPDVTVRSRGVMEKCTFCVQRIQKAKIDSKNERRPIEDGEVVPACAQTCPTQAITFGDLNNQDSQVRKKHDADRSYYTLEGLHLKPRTAFLARLKNPNPELVDSSEAKDTHEDSHQS